VNSWLMWMPLAVGVAEGVIAAVVGLAVGGAGIFTWERARSAAIRKKQAEAEAEGRKEAERLVKEARVEAKEQLLQVRSEFEKELQRQLAKREDTIDQKAEVQLKKERYLDNLEKDYSERMRKVAASEKQLEEALNEQKNTLFRMSNMTREQAVDLLLQRLESEVARAPGPRDRGRGHSALRRRAHRRQRGLRHRPAQRRHEGPDHRPRGPQHPGL